MEERKRRITFIDWLFWPSFVQSKDEIDNDKGLRFVVIMMLIGVIGIVIVSTWAAVQSKLNVFGYVSGLSVLVALAASLCGGFLGFLFGIPRSLQRQDSETITTNNNSRKRHYSTNTNLEQISDWLTKIIVGVSLTQLPNVQARFSQLTQSISSGFGPYIRNPYALPFTGALLIFYAICGFLAVYLWSKIYLLKQLTILEDQLDSRGIEQRVNNVNSKIERYQLENMMTSFMRAKNKILLLEASPNFKPILELAKPDAIQYADDGQKGRWGGKNSQDGFTATASFERVKDVPEVMYHVTTTVAGTEERPLTGDIYFFLHESYDDMIRKVTAADNKASLTFLSVEAFTVGIFLAEHNIKLELDLNKCGNCPDEYHYAGNLLTYDEIKIALEAVDRQE